jgi:PAS domain S-box-containing protein
MASETVDRGEISLLIVEDELILAEDLAITVKDLGYQVAAIASTGEEAIRLAADAMPSLVLMDVKLAGEIDGIQASEKIRSDYDLPVIFLTAYDGDDVLCRAKLTEPYGYLTKPVSHNILKITIETVLYKHKAEKRARDSEERLRLAMDASADGIWDWDIVTGAAYYSPSYFSMLGLEPGKYPTNFKTWVELMHPEDLNRALADNQDCIDGKTDCFASEFRMLHHDGTWRWILGRGKAVARDIEGKATRMAGTHTDITQRKTTEIALRESRNELEDRVAKRTAQLRFANEQLLEEIVERETLEDALRRSETRYRAIFEGAAEGILLADPQTMRFKLANPAMCRMLGYAEEESPALRIPDIFPEDELDSVLDDFRAISTKAMSETHDVRCLRKDGTFFYADIVASHTTIDEQKFLIGFFSDVTERRNASEALKRSDGMLRAVLDQMPSGVTIRDAHTGLVILANEKCREIMGSALETLSEFERYHFSRSDGSLYTNDEMPIFRSMASGELIDAEEVAMQSDDGSLRTVSISSAPVRDSAGHIILGVGVFDDITERKRAEEALRESEARFRSIFESATECIYITDKEFSVTHVNPACTSLFGRPSSEMTAVWYEQVHAQSLGEKFTNR